MERRLLSRAMAKRGTEVLHYTFPANCEEPWFPSHPKGALETAYLIEGRVTIMLGKEEAVLEAGDACTYPADLEHRVMNAGDTPARVIFVTRLPRQP